MNETSVVLSISMLISGKEDMPKSLESLQYFKQTFPCEIILVDTGCNSEQRAVAEKYADKIIDFAWCNDFAAARNAGLQEAKGEWFMFLDDDEWFDNPKEIISFFQSGEYKDYNSASYVVRNYTNAQGTMYEDSYPSRMVKLEAETKFVGKIHERLEPFRLPKRSFTDFAHHYGYVYKDEEQRKKHAYRNIEPLLEMRREHPGDPRWFSQLAQEYFSIKEYRKVIDCCRTGLEEWNALENQGEYSPVFVGAAYAFILISLDSLNAFEEEEEWLGKAFADPLSNLKIMEPTVAFYCMAGARLYSQTRDFLLCRDYFKRYIEYAKRLKDNRELIEVGTASVVEGVFQEQLLYGTILMCMGATIRMEDYRLAEEAFYLLDWSDRRLLHQEKLEKDMVDACCSVEYNPLWERILNTLASRPDGMKEMHVVFLETELDYQKQGETEKMSRLRHLVAELDCSHRYILYTKLLWTMQNPDIFSENERKKRVTELFGQMFKQYPGEIMETRAEIWDVAKQLDISMEPMLLQIDFRIWRQELEQWCREASLQSLQQWDIRIATWKCEPDIRYDFFLMKCMEGYLRNYQEIGDSDKGEERLRQLEMLLWKYADSVVGYYELLYRESVFQECPMVLPDEAQLGLELRKLRQFRECGDERKSLMQIRKCIGVYPDLEMVIQDYAKLYRDEVQRQNKEMEEERTELAGLIKLLKQTACQRMERGDFQTAREILRQILQCVPEDEEAQELLRKIEV